MLYRLSCFFLSRNGLLFLLPLLLWAVTIAPALAAEGPAWGLIVKLKPASTPATREGAKGAAVLEAPQAARERLAQVLGERVPAMQLRRTLATGSHLVSDGRVLDAVEARALAAQLADDPRVEYVVPNVRERLLQASGRVTPNDPLYGEQWWLQPRVSGSLGVPGLPEAWRRSTGSPAVVVAVLDSGVTSHDELNAQLLPGYDFVSEVEYSNDGNGRDSDPGDPGDFVTSGDLSNLAFEGCEVGNSSWHGTRIAGQIAAVSNNQAGVAGLAWQTRILPVRVSGKCGASVADIVDGMLWAAGLEVPGVPPNSNPARILNLSFGGNGPCNSAYADAIGRVRERGAILVTAAGNERGQVTRPGNCAAANVITVGSLNRQGFKSTYSNLGGEVTLSTVGGDGATGGACDRWLADDGLLTLSNTGTQQPGSQDYERVGGTSFSTPVVSGVAALMLALNPGLSLAELRDGLVRTAQPHVDVPKLGTCSATNAGRCSCTTSTCGAGILDAEQALLYAQGPQSYQPPVRAPVRVDNDSLSACAASSADPSLPPEATPSPEPSLPNERNGGDGDGGGGGALDSLALLLLGLVSCAALAARRRRPGAARRPGSCR